MGTVRFGGSHVEQLKVNCGHDTLMHTGSSESTKGPRVKDIKEQRLARQYYPEVLQCTAESSRLGDVEPWLNER